MSVATCVAEAEAHITSAQERFWKRAIKMWTDMHTLPETHPLSKSIAGILQIQTSASLTLLSSGGNAESHTYGTHRDYQTFHVSALGKSDQDNHRPTSRRADRNESPGRNQLAGRNGLRGTNRRGQLSQERCGGNRRSNGDEVDGTKHSPSPDYVLYPRS